ncbi:RluA family pseudouridine synthase [Synechococcus sp. PCC 7336]|uniref:RluA family pseudouridine synthase n=1 Tax=Synechococcus sp. PCC 7336 TaxID=195250 RepID=UPI00034D3A47|nr:RluA family pseudouridine synthase [Synechococcus sp. PCC 7336]
MNRGWIYREQVDRCAAGQTVLAYYTQQHRHSSQTEWLARIEAGQIWLDNRPATAATLLRVGQHLAYRRPPWQEPEVPLGFDIRYEDPDLLVVAKPAGLPVLPGGGFLDHTLLKQLEVRYPQAPPVPVHRLGRGTSGLVLLARSPLAKADLSRQMRDRQIHKLYRALIGPGDLPDRCAIETTIGKVRHPLLGYLYAATETGKFARSDCQVLERRSDATLVEVAILTGRPHQIRIHLASVGYPLLGDPLYAIGGVPKPIPPTSTDKVPLPGDGGYHLHACRLSFNHPRTDRAIAVECLAPEILS